MTKTTTLALMVLTLAAMGCSEGDDGGAASPHSTPAPQAAATTQQQDAGRADSYPIDFCVVSGQKLGSMGDPVVVEVEGRTVKLCCASCEPALRAEPEEYLAKLDAATHDGSPGHGSMDHGADGHDQQDH